MVALAVFWVDQLTKAAINNAILPGQHHAFIPGVQLVDVHNHGELMGVGLVSNELRLILALVTFGPMAALFVARPLLEYWRHGVSPRWLERWAVHRYVWLPIGLLLGGSLGNMGEMFSKGSATDFIYILGSNYAFNLADLAGVLGMLMMLFFVRPLRRRTNVELAPGQAPATGTA